VWLQTKEEEVLTMFIVIISFPPIKPGKDEEFREWFAWSNKEFSNYKGLINRRLLKPFIRWVIFSYPAVFCHHRHADPS
jgi:hypothetical protein